MKKVLRGICLMGVVALLATSCNKDNKTTTIQTVSEQMEEISMETGEKVWLDNTINRLYFTENDMLQMFGINPTETGPDYATAQFTPAAGSQVDNNTTWTPVDPNNTFDIPGFDLYAFCPGNPGYVTPNLGNEHRATFSIPAEQNYVENSLPHEGFFMAAKRPAGETGALYFRNICGALRLQLYSPNNRKVTSIVVDDKRYNLSGDVTLKIDKIDVATLRSLYNTYKDEGEPGYDAYMVTLNDYIVESGYEVTNPGPTMTLNCGEGVEIGTTKATATSFYITMRPLAMRKGVDITVNCEGGYSKVISTNKNNIIGPNIIKAMPAVNIQ